MPLATALAPFTPPRHTPHVPPIAPELHRVTSQHRLWHAHDSASKTELFSTAPLVNNAQVLVDPIELAPNAVGELIATTLGAIVITNANHHRAAIAWSDRFDLPIRARAGVFEAGAEPSRFQQCREGDLICAGLEVIAIEGAVPGEIALYQAGTLILGDCLINFEPYGFTFLPPKYCSDAKAMKHSLRQLLDRAVERIFFAHGTPIIKNAGNRLAALLS